MVKRFFNKKLTLILRSDNTGKKIDKIKFTKEETAELRKTADLIGITEKELIDEAFNYILKRTVHLTYFKGNKDDK